MIRTLFRCGVLASAIVLSCGGCLFFPKSYQAPEDYDLVPGKTEEPPLAVQIGVIRNGSGADRRFLIREADGRMQRDEYRRWIMDPELLLARCLNERLGYPGNDAEKNVAISGELMRFEFDRASGTAHLEAVFVLKRGSRRRVVKADLSREYAGPGGAAAMSGCVDGLSDLLRGEIARLEAEK